MRESTLLVIGALVASIVWAVFMNSMVTRLTADFMSKIAHF
jgi:hypothetical protein